MSSENTAHSTNADSGLPFAAFYRSELWGAPYKVTAIMWLKAQHNVADMLRINRKLSDELLQISRQEQDRILDLSERLFDRLSHGNGQASGKTSSPTIPLEQFFENAITGAREFSQAVVEVQVHSLEAIRDHAHATVETSKNSGNDGMAAA